ncbi:hypothetical protein F5B18DRAFT_669251 [Nemania serpens]|nr:hypothetical protein F5B18DRAFT_669251 [Nemania serpens]
MSNTRFSQASRSSPPYPSFPPSRPGSGGSSKSSGGGVRDHELSVDFYSPENGHWAAYSRHRDSQMGTIQHVRSDTRKDQDKFYYDEKSLSSKSPSLYGRSVVARMSSGEVARAQASIRDYASNDDNIPRVSRQQNCQTFVGGALGRLEREGLVRPGHSQYFSQQYGRPGTEIEKRLQEDGRHFERSAKDQLQTRSAPAARFGEPSTRPHPGKLNMRAFSHLSP